MKLHDKNHSNMTSTPNQFGLDFIVKQLHETGKVDLSDTTLDRITRQPTTVYQTIALSDVYVSRIPSTNGPQSYPTSSIKVVPCVETNGMLIPTKKVSVYSKPLLLQFVAVVDLSTPELDRINAEKTLKSNPEAVVVIMDEHKESVNLTAVLGPNTSSSAYQPIWDGMYAFDEDEEASLSLGSMYTIRFFEWLANQCKTMVPNIDPEGKFGKPTAIQGLKHKVHNTKYMEMSNDPDFRPRIRDGETVPANDQTYIPIKILRPEIPNRDGLTGQKKDCMIYYRDTGSGNVIPLNDYINDTFVHNGEHLTVSGREWVANIIVAPSVGGGKSGPILRYKVKEMLLIKPTRTSRVQQVTPMHIQQSKMMNDLFDMCDEAETYEFVPDHDVAPVTNTGNVTNVLNNRNSEQAEVMSNAFSQINVPVQKTQAVIRPVNTQQNQPIMQQSHPMNAQPVMQQSQPMLNAQQNQPTMQSIQPMNAQQNQPTMQSIQPMNAQQNQSNWVNQSPPNMQYRQVESPQPLYNQGFQYTQ
jgi:hypothetical protein